MTGPKLNERNFVAGERSGTKASTRGTRMSASKARVVLNLVRGLDVVSADQVLQFTEREAARVIRKVLASAVANAVNNDGLDAETLFIKACFADEGPTMRRFKPRARGRASRINKRTCHITIILGVLDSDKLQIVQARRERAISGRRAGRAGGGVASRRARVEASRSKRTGDGSQTDASAPEDAIIEDVVTQDESATQDAPAKKAAAKKAAAKKPAADKPEPAVDKPEPAADKPENDNDSDAADESTASAEETN
jgi:large subunit ribosomal protein L22